MFNRPLFQVLFCILLTCLPLAFISGQTQSEFKSSGKVWGLAFTDFFWKASGDTATWASRAEYSGTPADVYAFGLRRAYLGYDYQWSPQFSASVLLEGNDLLQAPRGDRTVTIKSLHVRWKNIYPDADLLVGQMPTLAFSFMSEKIWGYRSVEKTIMDQRGVRSSSDMGVALMGKVDSLGSFGYNIMIGNGSGTRPEELTQTGKHKIYSGEIYGYFLDRKLVLDLYADYLTGVNDRTVLTLKGFAGVQLPAFTFGAEIFSLTQNNLKTDGSDVNPLGYSIFARAPIVKDKLTVFARYDSFDPDNAYRTQDAPTAYLGANMFRHYSEGFFVAGLDFAPHKSVHIIPNIWINSYEAKAESNVLVDRKADIVPRVTVYFTTR
ncbi:MAG: hypothetical protein ABIQ11_05185 [Saprospiraceae bacterium]